MRSKLAGIAALVLLTAATVAGSGTAGAGVSRVEVALDGDRLLVTGTGAPARDEIELGVNDSESRYVVEANRPIEAPSCRPGDGAPKRVRCPSAGVLTIGVFLESGSDTFKVASRRVAATVVAFGGRGDDRLRGGVADDFLGGGRGHDELRGRGGNDKLRGAQGRDELRGGRGNDSLNGGPGRDECRGGPGRDALKSC